MNRRCNIVMLITVLVLTGCGAPEPDLEYQVIPTKIEEAFTTEQTKSEERTEESLQEESAQEEAEKLMGKLLQTALLPVGSTMYIWGGGWNEEDTGAGVGATTIGVYPQWAEFAADQTPDYNMKEHRYEILNGLDCSGYIGWLVYNVMESEEGQNGYVYSSTDMAKAYSELGFGTYIEAPDSFLTGDIVSMKGHVWMALGTCEDGSVVLVHSSPPGVSLCGTLLADGSESEAVRLAREYMTKYFPKWQEKYPDRSVASSYLNAVGLLRWNEEVMPGAEWYRRMDVREVLEEIF